MDDQIVKYTSALRLGAAEAEQVLRRFTCGGLKHPTYRAIEELGGRYSAAGAVRGGGVREV
ncbi:Tn3 family transposase [Streptomyces sp. SID2563]|uniref:Tn3 family transposase n=1 Tax=Streptomyces sp. SID2563 TaxID=2690255 RepID=UPI0013681B20|nr:Tn3 family transposase [Streptomyces sp. SID2563]MYW08539.1 Tn3 family transposase [Streptomyces sp. SID2563]